MVNYDNILSDSAKSLKASGIRKFFSIAREMEGVVSLGVGEPDFKTPYFIREAGIHSLERGHTWYTANTGIKELRDEITKYLERRFDISYDPDHEIIVTVGGSEAIDGCIRSVCNVGDEVLIPQPSFVSYSPCVALCGAIPVPIPLPAENNFKLTLEMLKNAITDKTKMLIMPFPNNPTGSIMTKEELAPIAEYLKDKEIIVLSDEIYSELTYDNDHVSIASFDGMWDRTIVVNGFSKSYAMTGWRLGYACGPREIISQMNKIHQYAIMCAPTTSQFAAIAAVKNGDDSIAEMRDEYSKRRKLIVAGFNKIGLDCHMPQGAFYVFPSIKSTGLSSGDFCEKLLYAKKVAVVPGDAFGESGEGYIRVSYSYSTKHIITALERIEEFIKELG